jgi:xanthine/CO dehydrogenase XdhC/CoxF family maturation factor
VVDWVKIPIGFSLAVVATLIGLSVIASLIAARRRRACRPLPEVLPPPPAI